MEDINEILDILKKIATGVDGYYPEDYIGSIQCRAILDHIATKNKEIERLNNIIEVSKNKLIELQGKFGYAVDDVIFKLSIQDTNITYDEFKASINKLIAELCNLSKSIISSIDMKKLEEMHKQLELYQKSGLFNNELEEGK